MGDNARASAEALVKASPIARARGDLVATTIEIPTITPLADAEQSTQAAFGKMLFELARGDSNLADRVVTTSPDVTVSTNLGAWVNRRGPFRRQEVADVFAAAKVPTAQKWAAHGAGQHIELGVAENNLFLMLAAAGLAAPLFGNRLFPVGTVYDPFIARGLYALNYATYMDARFLLVATPSGVTLGHEGGAHQSISSPLVGMGQPGLTYYEPAFADELAAIMELAFDRIQASDGGSTYLRLTTRPIFQPTRADDCWREGALAGGYWMKPPAPGAEAAIVYCGAIAPEALSAWGQLVDDVPGLGLLAVTSADLLHAGWTAQRTARWTGERGEVAQVARLLAPLSPTAGLVTVIDGHPATLSWLGSVRGQRTSPLGVERFGQTGDLNALYRHHRIDARAICDAAAELFL